MINSMQDFSVFPPDKGEGVFDLMHLSVRLDILQLCK